MLSEKLKQQTEDSHQKLEKHLVSRIKAISDPEHYTDILSAFYGFIFPVEKLIEPYAASFLPDHAERRKSASIADDLEHFGGEKSGGKEASAHDLPVVNSSASAMGALYVLEGSTLGGEFITKMITKKMGVKEDAGFSYFNSYGENRMEMWNRFKTALNSFGQEGDQETVIKAANDTFNQFCNWLNTHADHK